MPTLKQASRVDMSKYEPVPASNKVPHNVPLTSSNVPGRSPFMHASMPVIASTSDAFSRQFYSNSGTPSYRILPAQRGEA